MTIQIFTISNLFNLTYYVLVATRFPGSGSFSKELSNDPVWLGVAQDRWGSKDTFEAYCHGRPIQEEVEGCSGSHKKTTQAKPSDNLRTNLRIKLNTMLRK
jgi:hypothetical protein